MAPTLLDGGLPSAVTLPATRIGTRQPSSNQTSSKQISPRSLAPRTLHAGPLKPGQIDPAVEPLRKARPQRFRDARPGHLAVVAMAGRPWFIGRVSDLDRGHRAAQSFAHVIDIDTGEFQRIPAPWIVELLGEGAPEGPLMQH
ncbi:MAG: hypothetical protein WBM08_10350 [Prochlorococcaceae cyanobacterium]